MNFKVGQKVKLIDNNGMAADIGATAVISKIGNGWIKVVWLAHANRQMNGRYPSYHFKPAIKRGEQLLFDFANEA